MDKDYGKDHALIPHGLSVITTAPADFIFTTPVDPKRHLEAANLLGAALPDAASIDQISHTLADILRSYMKDFNCPNGLQSLGFDRTRVDDLALAAMGFLKANKISPKDTDLDAVSKIYDL